MRTVTATPIAADGFDAAQRWLLQSGAGPASAKRWQALAGVLRLLKDHPFLGTAAAVPGCRQLTVAGYRVLYETSPDADAAHILILAVLAPGQP